jgi:exonuclease SbcC
VKNDAELELALTSKRDGVAPGSHAVRLDFNSGEKVVRGPNTVTEKAEIIALLTAPEWNTPVADLGTYLALTHFAPQSQREQFLHREIKEQWEMLKLPAGAEEVERLRLLLGNPGTSRAFNSAVEAATKALEEQRKLRVEFDALAAEITRLRSLAHAGESLSPDALRIEVSAILLTLLGEPVQVGEIAPESAEPEPLLAAAGETLSRAEVATRTDELRIATAESLLQQWRALREKQAASSGQKIALEERVIVGQTAAKTLQRAIETTQTEIQPAENEHASLATRIDALSRLINALQLRDELTLAATRAGERLRAVLEQNAAQMAERERLEKVRAERQQVLVQLSEARRGRELFTEKGAIWTAFLAAASAAAEASQNRDAAQAQIAEQLRKIEGAKQRVEKSRTKIASLQSQLASGQQIAREIDQAVSAIAARLTEADTRCPVCAYSYPQPGDLKRLAEQSAALMRADFPGVAQQIASHREEMRLAEIEAAAAEEERLRLVHIVATLNKVISAASEKREAIDNDEVLRVPSLDDMPSFLEARLLQFTDLEKVGMARLLQFESGETLAAKLRESGETLARLATERTAAQRAAAELEQRAAQAHAIIATHRTLLEETGNSVDALRGARDESLHRRESLANQLTQRRSRLAEQERELRELTAAVASGEQQRIESAASLAELRAVSEESLRQWNELRLTETATDAPTESDLTAFRAAAVAKATRLRELRAQHQRALTGFERWRDNQQLTTTEARLRGALAASGSENLEQHRTWLGNNENLARQELAQAERARQLATRLKETMQREAESYSSTVLEPLNERISALHAMLSPSHEFAFDFNVRQHKSRTDFRLHMSVAEDEDPLDPYLRLSEGQLSALNLTVLLAASTAYRWSRWRALLLDDPLQQNDLIHAAAFLDVVRDLVQQERYQVILSTHDLEHANFIDRKCRGAGIPVQRCWLLSGTETGVRYRAETLSEETEALT